MPRSVPLLSVLGAGNIYANPYPADWPIHAWYPNVVRLNSGDLLCFCRLGAAMYSDDGRIVQFRSSDRGETWVNEGVVRDGSADPKVGWYAPSGIARLRNGEIVLTGFRIQRPAPNVPTCNDVTGACLPEETFLIRSADEGRTWSDPLFIQKPHGLHLEAYGGVIPLVSGEWLQVFDVMKAYDDAAPSKPRVVALLSPDQGRTWTGPVPVAGSPAHPKTFWHMRPACMDGCPIGFAWSGDETGQTFLDLHRVIGTPDGRSWSEPSPTGLPGQTNCPVNLGAGRLAIAYTRRGGDAPGIYVALSADEGLTWDLDLQIHVWDAYGRESLGVPRTSTYPSSHDNIAFGAPNLIRAGKDELLASYWAVVAGQTVSRWSKLRISFD